MLLLELGDFDSEPYIEILEWLDITGKRLDTFFEKCCHCDIDYVRETLCYLQFEYISKKDILANLDSSNPIPFINRLPESNFEYLNDHLYAEYTSVFNNLFNQRKGR